nr:hypothetical protein [Tanacetum cinerariifolium]
MQSIQTFLKKFNRISFRETSTVLTQAWDKFFEIQHAQSEDTHELLCKLLEDLKIINEELVEYINFPSWNRYAFYDDDDDDYSIQVSKKCPIAIAPVLPTEELENSLSMGDEHLDTIPETESDEVIKSSVEDLVPIPSESEGIFDSMCDVPFSDKNHFDAESDLIESLLTRDTSIVYSPKIDSLLEDDHTEETSSGSTTTHADNSLSEYDSFLFKIEPDQGELSSVAMEAILEEPRVYVPNVLPIHPTLYQDSDCSSSDDSFGSGLEVSFPSGNRNKIFDPGIFIEVHSERLLSREEFSISFICDPLYPVFDSLFPFSSKNEDKVFKPGILFYLLVSHQDKITSDFSENPMMMYEGIAPDLEASRARCFVHRPLKLQSFVYGNPIS